MNEQELRLIEFLRVTTRDNLELQNMKCDEHTLLDIIERLIKKRYLELLQHELEKF